MKNESHDARSRQMAKVRSKDTKPELNVRRLVFSMGYRYRVHASNLPGKPDLVFASRKKIIFFHGCFWHRHEGCKLATTPASNQAYWLPKLERNVTRDRESLEELKKFGWDVLVIWECQLKDVPRLTEKLRSFLDNKSQV